MVEIAKKSEKSEKQNLPELPEKEIDLKKYQPKEIKEKPIEEKSELEEKTETEEEENLEKKVVGEKRAQEVIAQGAQAIYDRVMNIAYTADYQPIDFTHYDTIAELVVLRDEVNEMDDNDDPEKHMSITKRIIDQLLPDYRQNETYR